MPEGDTVAKIAAYMQPKLQHHEVTQARAGRVVLREWVGRRITDVRAVGKHLLVQTPAWILRVHLGMHGSWHRYAPGEAWRRPQWQGVVVLGTCDDIFVCFNPQQVECLRAEEVPTSQVGALGPDLLASTCDLDIVLERALRLPAATLLCDVLLNQRVAAGIGNVYKCEILFVHRLHPLTPVGCLDPPTLRSLFATARCQLQSNLGGWRRTTTYDRRRGEIAGKPRLYVYSRRNEPCYACTGRIVKKILGKTRRVTYWCPACQAAVGSP